MIFTTFTKLDNPAWHSLNEVHQSFAVGNEDLKMYAPNYSPFGGVKAERNVASYFNKYLTSYAPFFIIGAKPLLPSNIIVEKELVCLQMVCINPVKVLLTENIIRLTDDHADLLYEIVNMVQPGYFKKDTSKMGDYFGIKKNKELVAVAGERMRMNDFTEISAVVTHPEYTRRGFAQQLIAFTVNKNQEKNKISYLHVLEDNLGAINLYEKLGFETRRRMSFWKLRRIR